MKRIYYNIKFVLSVKFNYNWSDSKSINWLNFYYLIIMSNFRIFLILEFFKIKQKFIKFVNVLFMPSLNLILKSITNYQ